MGNILTAEDLIPKFDFKGKEKDIEAYILDNIDDISKNCGWGEIVRIESQFTLKLSGNNKIRVDIMLWHKDGTGTLIEVKSTNTNRLDILSASSQCLFYGQIIEEQLGVLPRLVVAGNQIHYDVYKTTSRFNLPICFLMVDGDRCIYLS